MLLSTGAVKKESVHRNLAMTIPVKKYLLQTHKEVFGRIPRKKTDKIPVKLQKIFKKLQKHLPGLNHSWRPIPEGGNFQNYI